ncbi:hypothetical protein GCM10022295_29640 [Streptomyces osmaniensis]|uniref:Transposase n=1 Tax=Streptomyces osmaniensis TaxID=593134 RepID=A0ABP6W835_9ACTN
MGKPASPSTVSKVSTGSADAGSTVDGWEAVRALWARSHKVRHAAVQKRESGRPRRRAVGTNSTPQVAQRLVVLPMEPPGSEWGVIAIRAQ